MNARRFLMNLIEHSGKNVAFPFRMLSTAAPEQPVLRVFVWACSTARHFESTRLATAL